jgi:hypothetical protein
MGAAGVWLANQDKLNGIELSILVFVLALFVISPAVLLLLERPLKGVDT